MVKKKLVYIFFIMVAMPLSVVGQVVPPPIPPPPPPGLSIDQGVYFFLAIGVVFGVVVIKKKQ